MCASRSHTAIIRPLTACPAVPAPLHCLLPLETFLVFVSPTLPRMFLDVVRHRPHPTPLFKQTHRRTTRPIQQQHAVHHKSLARRLRPTARQAQLLHHAVPIRQTRRVCHRQQSTTPLRPPHHRRKATFRARFRHNLRIAQQPGQPFHRCGITRTRFQQRFPSVSRQISRHSHQTGCIRKMMYRKDGSLSWDGYFRGESGTRQKNSALNSADIFHF